MKMKLNAYCPVIEIKSDTKLHLNGGKQSFMVAKSVAILFKTRLKQKLTVYDILLLAPSFSDCVGILGNAGKKQV